VNSVLCVTFEPGVIFTLARLDENCGSNNGAVEVKTKSFIAVVSTSGCAEISTVILLLPVLVRLKVRMDVLFMGKMVKAENKESDAELGSESSGTKVSAIGAGLTDSESDRRNTAELLNRPDTTT